MSDATPPVEYTLEALEEATGTSARTIRYYISQGLVPAALTVGRTATYGEVHLATLKRIAEAKAQGLSLEQIRHQLHPPSGASALLPRSEPWSVLQVTDNVAVLVRVDLPPGQKNQIEKALVPFVAALTRKTSEEG